MSVCVNRTAYGSAGFCGKPEGHFVHVPSEHGACTDKRYCMYHPFEVFEDWFDWAGPSSTGQYRFDRDRWVIEALRRLGVALGLDHAEDRTRFVLAPEEWEAFSTAIAAEPRVLPRLAAFLTTPSVPERE